MADDEEFVSEPESGEEIRDSVDDAVADDELDAGEGGFVEGYKRERDREWDEGA